MVSVYSCPLKLFISSPLENKFSSSVFITPLDNIQVTPPKQLLDHKTQSFLFQESALTNNFRILQNSKFIKLWLTPILLKPFEVFLPLAKLKHSYGVFK